jgi:hypothetical protein
MFPLQRGRRSDRQLNKEEKESRQAEKAGRQASRSKKQEAGEAPNPYIHINL